MWTREKLCVCRREIVWTREEVRQGGWEARSAGPPPPVRGKQRLTARDKHGKQHDTTRDIHDMMTAKYRGSSENVGRGL